LTFTGFARGHQLRSLWVSTTAPSDFFCLNFSVEALGENESIEWQVFIVLRHTLKAIEITAHQGPTYFVLASACSFLKYLVSCPVWIQK
jgi:hypothetical protein